MPQLPEARPSQGAAPIQQSNALPIGITEATLLYRPDTGFQPGDYRFEYELVTDDFTLRAPNQPSFTASVPSSANISRYVVIAAGTILTAAVAAAIWLITRRFRRR